MMRLFLSIALLAVIGAASAQDKPIPWGDFSRELLQMQRRVEAMAAELNEFDLPKMGKQAGVQDKHGWLASWNGFLYLRANEARAFHNRHKEALNDTWAWTSGQPKQVHPRYLEYYRDGMRQLEQHHARMKREFGEFAQAWVGEVVAYERGGADAKKGAEAVTARERGDWEKLTKRVIFEKRVVDGPVPAPKVLSVGKLTIDYSGWHAERMLASEDLRKAKRDIDAYSKDIEGQRAKMREMSAEALRLQSAYSAKVTELGRAERMARGDLGTLTSPEIQALQRQYNATVAELAQVVRFTNASSGAEKRRLQSRQRQLRVKRNQAKSRLDMLRADLKEDAQARAQASIERLINAKYDALKPLAQAESELGIQAGVLDTMLKGYQEAVDQHDQLLLKLGKLGSEAPVITLVKASGYEAKLWEPEDVLRDLDKDIRASEGLLWDFDGKRRHQRQEMLRASEQMNAMAGALARSQYASLMAQAGLEAAYTGAELAGSFKEGGLPKVLADASKKIVENVLVPPSYADPNNLIPREDTAAAVAYDLLPSIWKAPEITVKRLAKQGTTGYASGYALEAYLTSQARQSYNEIALRMVRQSWVADEASRASSAQLSEVLENRKKLLESAEKKLADLGGWKGYLKKASKDLAWGLFKDVSKSALKQGLANMIEGEAWQNHKAAELEYRSRVLLLYQASNSYWKAYDALEHLRSLRRSLLDQYDPGSSMKISNRGRIESDEDLVFELSDRGVDSNRPSSREIDLYFGDVKAERIGQGALAFKIAASKLENMAVAPHDVRIVVRG